VKHHYIPQFYLEPWVNRETDNKLTEYRRLTFDNEPRHRLEIKRRGRMETGWEKNLYIIPGATKETRQNVERIFMGAVDGKAALAHDIMLGGEVPMEPELRHAWSRFLLSLMIRTPEEIRAFKTKVRTDLSTPNPEYQERYEALRRDEWPDTLEEYINQRTPLLPERTAVLMITKLIQNEKILKTLMGSEWWLLDTSNRVRRILTSDHPLIMTNGLGRPDGHFALPISPNLVFVAFMRPEFGARVRQLAPGKLLREINDVVIGQGRRSVYAFDEQSTTEVKRRMSKRPYMAPMAWDVLKS
jgi:Protein of unknown function (DUF4238)